MKLGDATFTLIAVEEHGWASATFAGVRAVFDLKVEHGAINAGFAEELAEAEFLLPGHFVAEIAVDYGQRTIRLTALILTDA